MFGCGFPFYILPAAREVKAKRHNRALLRKSIYRPRKYILHTPESKKERFLLLGYHGNLPLRSTVIELLTRLAISPDSSGGGYLVVGHDRHGSG